MRVKICKNILAAFEFEISAADFHGDDFLICQGRLKAAATQPIFLSDDAVLFINEQKHSGNKTVPIHWRTPFEQGLDTAVPQDAFNGSGIVFKSCTLGFLPLLEGAGDLDCALAFDESNDLRHRILGRYGKHDMHISQVVPQFDKDSFLAAFQYPDNVIRIPT